MNCPLCNWLDTLRIQVRTRKGRKEHRYWCYICGFEGEWKGEGDE